MENENILLLADLPLQILQKKKNNENNFGALGMMQKRLKK